MFLCCFTLIDIQPRYVYIHYKDTINTTTENIFEKILYLNLANLKKFTIDKAKNCKVKNYVTLIKIFFF